MAHGEMFSQNTSAAMSHSSPDKQSGWAKLIQQVSGKNGAVDLFQVYQDLTSWKESIYSLPKGVSYSFPRREKLKLCHVMSLWLGPHGLQLHY